MCKVCAKRRQARERDAALHRPPKQNPFVIGRDGSRAGVIAKYRAWIAAQPALMNAFDKPRGRDLICWCPPLACHGDLLVDLANRR